MMVKTGQSILNWLSSLVWGYILMVGVMETMVAELFSCLGLLVLGLGEMSSLGHFFGPSILHNFITWRMIPCRFCPEGYLWWELYFHRWDRHVPKGQVHQRHQGPLRGLRIASWTPGRCRCAGEWEETAVSISRDPSVPGSVHRSENGSEIDQNRRMYPIILSYKDGAFPSDGPLLPLKSGSSFCVHKSSPISGPPKKTGRSHGIQKISKMARSAPRFNFPVVHPKVSLSGTCTLTRGEDGLIVPWMLVTWWF